MTRLVLIVAEISDDAPAAEEVTSSLTEWMGEAYTADGTPFTFFPRAAEEISPEHLAAFTAAATVGLDNGDEDSTGFPEDILDRAHEVATALGNIAPVLA